jgi:hypothetical protein
VINLLKALLGNGSVNTFQNAKKRAVFSVDEYNRSMLGSTTILATERGVFYVIGATQQKYFLRGPRHATIEMYSMWSVPLLHNEGVYAASMRLGERLVQRSTEARITETGMGELGRVLENRRSKVI